MGQPKNWRGTIEERLLARLAINPETECWEWTGAKVGGGYGVITRDGHQQVAHRAAYELFIGPIPDGMQIDHLCRNRACCKPEHLEPVSALVNNRRSGCLSTINAAKTLCPRGHAYDYIDPRGHRRCRTCRNMLKQFARAGQSW